MNLMDYSLLCFRKVCIIYIQSKQGYEITECLMYACVERLDNTLCILVVKLFATCLVNLICNETNQVKVLYKPTQNISNIALL